MTTMLIGQAPSKGTEDKTPFSGETGTRIAGMAKMPPSALAGHYALRNALDYFPGKEGKGDAFPPEEAKAAIERIVDQVKGTEVDRLIFVGRGTANAFALDVDHVGGYLAWFRTAATGPRVWLAILPHPSGINRWYNDPQNRAAAALFLQLEIRSRGDTPVPRAQIDEAELHRSDQEDAATAGAREETF
jgi:uracil-DNA glycosylase